MTAAKNAQSAALEALIEAHATELKLPTVKRRFRALAQEAVREQQTPVAYLAALLEAEHQERAERRERRRLIDARFPALKRLDDYRFADNSKIPQATIAALAEGSWIRRPRVGDLHRRQRHRKTHLATALGDLRLPARPPRPLHHAGRAGQRAPRSRIAASSPGSSGATPAPSSSSWTNSATSPCPTAPPSSSSRSSPNATNADR